MPNDTNINLSDYDRLKAINLGLSEITHKRKACRRKTNLFGAMGGILLAASIIGFFHNIVNMDDDWANNPNSPVYKIVTHDKSGFKLPIPVSLFGLLAGFTLFYKAKRSCAERDQLCDQEWALNHQMRGLRDQMYPHDIANRERRHSIASPEHTQPLNADAVRGEYVGVYSPPGSRQAHAEERRSAAPPLQIQAS